VKEESHTDGFGLYVQEELESINHLVLQCEVARE
jgi:hypothetical protein